MKKNLIAFYIILAGAMVALLLNVWQPKTPALAASQTSTDTQCNSSRSVQVSGTAVLYVTPDRAAIQLGVQSNGSTPDGVQNANFQEIQKVIAAIKALGVDAKDIATDSFIVYPVYDDYNSLVIKGYRIDNTVSITVKNIDLVDDVVLAALKVGANEVQDVQFYSSELRKYRDQARDMAIKAAGEKGQALAHAAGTETGCVLSINENSWSSYYGSWRGGRNAALWTQNVAQNVAPAQDQQVAGDTPISLGQIAIQAQVNASYSLR
jgi:uncharacterized protein